jgi:hypothetical protein
MNTICKTRSDDIQSQLMLFIFLFYKVISPYNQFDLQFYVQVWIHAFVNRDDVLDGGIRDLVYAIGKASNFLALLT